MQSKTKRAKKVNKIIAVYTTLNNNLKNLWAQFSDQET